jgi:hypothetical protein
MLNTLPKEYTNVRRFYVAKYGDKKGVELFDTYMKRKHKTLRYAVEVIPWKPMRTVYRKTITRKRATNLLIKRRV